MKSKEIVHKDLNKQIRQIQFTIQAQHDIENQAEVEVYTRDLYSIDPNTPGKKQHEGGVLDRKLGISTKDDLCETCQQKQSECAGHWGFIRLALPIFHAGYFKATMTILQQICKSCARILLTDEEAAVYLRRLHGNLDNPQKMALLKHVSKSCKKATTCPHCESTNGTVKKCGVLRLVHEKYRNKTKEAEKNVFMTEFNDVVQELPEMKAHINKAADDLTPLKVIDLFRQVNASDCELLGLDADTGRPEYLLWTFLPVPPVCIRPSVAMTQGDAGSNEDDLTVKLAEAITLNQIIQKSLDEGDTSHKVSEDWENLQLIMAQFINSELPGLAQAMNSTKWIRGVCQRLKGKQGRFRGNLSGKRVDFSARTVISPDPNLRIDQVAIPEHIAKIMTYPERVTQYNIDHLRTCVINGSDKLPGANYIQQDSKPKKFLKFVSDRTALAADLKVGDMVERHLKDGDVVLFNRQPSLHKLSIMSHYAKIRPWRTFRFNECVCTPYNADFDGDEMNLHVPQTEEAIAEAVVLMGTKNNLVTPRNGQPLIAATQDFITGSFLISRKDTFFTRDEFCQTVTFMLDALEHINLPKPAIVKPFELWTGKQVFNVLMQPNKACNVNVNMECKTRSYIKNPKQIPDLCPNDGWLVIQNSEVLCGVIDKSVVGDGSKDSLFYVVMRDFGEVAAASCMNRLAKLCARYMGNRGFSIGIEDVTPGEKLSKLRDQVIETGYEICDSLIQQYKDGTLACQAGCDEEQTLEAQISGKLSKIRDDLGQICLQELNKHNAPLVMSMCGSKGSKINVCQMIACVGQQIISGSRAANGFDDRTLPHFKKHSKSPAAKGFVKHSFFDGLSPTEFVFHAMSGREGLVDTAVKTAETGYMQRRLMKAMEDLAVLYDYSVRNSVGNLVQFDYGNDRLDPAQMETDDEPVDFKKALYVSMNSKTTGKRLSSQEIMQQVQWFTSSQQFIELTSQEYAEQLTKYAQEHIANVILYNQAEFGSHSKNMLSLSKRQMQMFLDICQRKFHKAKIEPGCAVGALGAQSIGEPGTQMTLKTFHFAGVASMSITLGVPRIREIINASKSINTPIIAAKLVTENNETAARIVKGRIEASKLGGIIEAYSEVINAEEGYLEMKVDWSTIQALQLEISMDTVVNAILQAPKLKIRDDMLEVSSRGTIRIYAEPRSSNVGCSEKMFYLLQNLKRKVPDIVVNGIPLINRAVINVKEGSTTTFELLAEGYGLQEVINTDGIVGTQTTSNHVIEVEKVLGIEAARQTIIDQIQYTMSSHGMTIDKRHVMLLADTMTFKGEVLGITRFGISKMKDSVLMLASFEKTTDHLFDASLYGKKDAVEGVSECIIMGIPMKIGTGMFQIMHDSKTFPQAADGVAKKGKKNVAPKFVIYKRPVFFDTPQNFPETTVTE